MTSSWQHINDMGNPQWPSHLLSSPCWGTCPHPLMCLGIALTLISQKTDLGSHSWRDNSWRCCCLKIKNGCPHPSTLFDMNSPQFVLGGRLSVMAYGRGCSSNRPIRIIIGLPNSFRGPLEFNGTCTPFVVIIMQMQSTTTVDLLFFLWASLLYTKEEETSIRE